MLAYLCMLTVFGIFGNKWESRRQKVTKFRGEIHLEKIPIYDDDDSVNC